MKGVFEKRGKKGKRERERDGGNCWANGRNERLSEDMYLCNKG